VACATLLEKGLLAEKEEDTYDTSYFEESNNDM
jgi:hypothetical protein